MFDLVLPADTQCNYTLFPSSRGGVLEPAGTVEIKFRRKDLVKAMRRLDGKYSELSQALAAPGRDLVTREAVSGH